ncbi:MAG TPA: PPK2 family polyphosphate kinase [Nitrososphaera sp.]|nr:PPK2 family polyphosphate kinase [Nitrososphaera sp.]
MSRIILSKMSTLPPNDLTKVAAVAKTQKWIKRIGELQHLLFAQKKQALLVVLQGMDGSGKDGGARNVFGECSPSGIMVYGFKKPTDEEREHDFLWRVHKLTPRKGMIHIFVRSHYEDVLVPRVHKWISKERTKNRINAINAFEELLVSDNRTVVLKFYLHISRKEQKRQLQERVEDPAKQWKHNPADLKESEHWDDYMRYYEDAINQSTIPWHIVPVDKRWYRDYVIAKTVCETLEKMKPRLPTFKTDVPR